MVLGLQEQSSVEKLIEKANFDTVYFHTLKGLNNFCVDYGAVG